MPNYEEIIKLSQANVKLLSEKLKDLDNLHQDIISLKTKSAGIPLAFEQSFHKIAELSKTYTETLGVASKTYLDGNNTLFTIKLNDLEVELKKISEKTNDFQKKITLFSEEINRLEEFDLEKHFDKLQKTLSDIFGAINAINLTLTSLTTSLNSVIQSLGKVQKVLEDNFKETSQQIKTFSTETNNHLINQDKKNDIVFETIKKEITNLSQQNIVLKKEIKTNRIIQIVGFVITISAIIYLIIKQ